MFDESLKYGGYGEHAVWNLFIKQSWVKDIVDVRDDPHFQEQDIDFLLENNKRHFCPIEVKTDFKAHETGNVVYEVTTSGNIGCFEKTKARWIAYFIPKKRVVHLIDVAALRTYIHDIQPEKRKMGDNATGFLLPIADLEKAKVIFKTYEGVI